MPPPPHALDAARLCLALLRLEARQAGLDAWLDAVRSGTPLGPEVRTVEEALADASPYEHVRLLGAFARPVLPLRLLFGPEDPAVRAHVVDRLLRDTDVRVRLRVQTHTGTSTSTSTCTCTSTSTCTCTRPIVAFEPGPSTGEGLPGAVSLPARVHAWLGGGLALLLEADEGDRLRRCDNRRCGEPFVDGSRGRRRRFCRPACANTAALTRQRARREAAALLDRRPGTTRP